PEPEIDLPPTSRTPISIPRVRATVAPPTLPRRKILFVDDDPTDQLIIGHMLSREGYAVTTTSCGEEGIVKAAQVLPAVILLDFMLPDIDAPEVLRRLRATPATRDIPVILLTATDQASHIAEGFQAGANDYLQKPVDVRRLTARI